MKHFPFPVRVAAGLAAATADTVRDLPKHLTELPVTVASQVLQTSMRVQQHVTELAIKGDDALAAFRGVEDEPNWATFDEDDDVPGSGVEAAPGAAGSEPGAEATFDDPWDAESQALGQEHPDGEFDSAEVPDAGDAATTTPATTTPATTTPATAASASDVTGGGTQTPRATDARDATDARGGGTSGTGPAGMANYDDLSLPQLRSRLRSFSADELEELLGYERDHENRPSFTGMLTRRIANVRAESAAEENGPQATGGTGSSEAGTS